MCRSIKTLFNFEPPANDDEVYSAALQYVRKVSGYTQPSKANQEPFDIAVAEVAKATSQLLEKLATHAAPRNREIEADKARARAAKRTR
jgi:hypothetical protein